MNIDNFNWESFRLDSIGVACYSEGSAKLFLHKAVKNKQISMENFKNLISADYANKERSIFFFVGNSLARLKDDQTPYFLLKIYHMPDECIIRSGRNILSGFADSYEFYKGEWINLNPAKTSKIIIRKDTVSITQDQWTRDISSVEIKDSFIRRIKRETVDFNTIKDVINRKQSMIFESIASKYIYRAHWIRFRSVYRIEKWNETGALFEPVEDFAIAEIDGKWDIVLK